MVGTNQTSQFHIAFDTNALFVEAEDRLINNSLSELIVEREKTGHPKIKWYLLDIVRAERRYQMAQVAMRLVGPAKKVGQLLGKDFGITQKGLEEGIDSVIDGEVRRHRLVRRELDPNLVDWNRIIERAVSRLPPFEAGKREKGFRDAVVLETFSQLVDGISKSKGYPRIVLITNDERLKEATEERMQGRDNVSTVDDLQTLKSMLNAYASEIGAAELEAILEKAQSMFYREDELVGLFFEWNIEQTINKKFGTSLREPPAPRAEAGYVDAHLVSVGPTTFVARHAQQLTFATYLEFLVIDVVQVVREQSVFPPGMYNFTSGPEPFRSSTSVFPGMMGTGHTFGIAPFPYLNSGTGAGAVNTGGLFAGTGSSGIAGGGFGGEGGFGRPTGYSGVPGPSGVAGLSGLNSGVAVGGIIPSARQPTFVPRQQGRKIFEVKWRANLREGSELMEPELIDLRPHSIEWSLPNW